MLLASVIFVATNAYAKTSLLSLLQKYTTFHSSSNLQQKITQTLEELKHPPTIHYPAPNHSHQHGSDCDPEKEAKHHHHPEQLTSGHGHFHYLDLPPSASVANVTKKDGVITVNLRLPIDYLHNDFDDDTHDAILESITGVLAEEDYTRIILNAANERGEFVQMSSFYPASVLPVYETPRNEDPFPDVAGDQSLRYNNPQLSQSQSTGALSGKTVWLGPGHGWIYYTSLNNYATQRGNTNEVVEDFGSIESINYYLLRYLYNAGANVWSVRERDMNLDEVIVDNDDGAPTYTETGTWATSGTPGYNGGTYRFLNSAASESGTAIYTPNIPKAGFYWVSVQYLNSGNRPVDTRYKIQHAGGETIVSIDQEIHGLTWVYLGQFYFDAGTSGSVILTNESSDVGQAVIADAVRFGGGMGTIEDCDVSGVGTSGEPRFEEGAQLYAPFQGYPTCNGDVSIRPLYAEWELAKGSTTEQNNACYVSWHTNAGGGQGTSSFIHDTAPTANSDILQDFVHAELVNDIQGCWDSGWTDRGQKTANFGEIRNLSTMPGVLLEVLFHDNSADAGEYTTPEFRQLAAKAVYQGITKYFANQDGVTAVLVPETPSHLVAKNTGPGEITVSWDAPIAYCGGGDPATDYSVYMGTHGHGFADGVPTSATSYTFTGLLPGTTYYFQVAASNAGGQSFPTPTVAARTPQSGSTNIPYLIVDGFDRIDRSSAVVQYESAALGNVRRLFLEHMNAYDYAVEHATAMSGCNGCGIAFDGALNEALIDGNLPIYNGTANYYEGINWFLGEESTTDRTFDATEASLVTNYLNNGGNLIVSGAEIGWDIGRAGAGNDNVTFYNNYLKAAYGGDSGNTYDFTGTGIFAGTSGSFDDGTEQYDSSYPDRLSTTGGSSIGVNYSGGTGDGAAINYKGTFGVVNFGFPLETVTSDAVREALMCTSIEYLAPPLTIAAVSSSNVTCNSGNDGTGFVEGSGGSWCYTYLWPTGATTDMENNLAAGIYNVTVTDDYGTTTTVDVSITEPAGINVSTNGINVSCNGFSDGSITATASGGAGGLTYAWNNGQTGTTASTLSAGTYTVTVTDANGCSTTVSRTITQPTVLVTSISSTNVTTAGGSDGTVTSSTTGGSGAPFLFNWNTGATTPNLTGVSAGTYTITVTDNNLCTAIASATVTAPTCGSLAASINANIPVSCNGGSDGQINLTVSGGNGGNTYLWSNGATTQNISGLVAGAYAVTITDNTNCTETANATVTQPTALNASASATDVSSVGGSDGTASVTFTGGTTPVIFTWSTGANTQNISGLSAGTYTVTLTDSNNCVTIASATVNAPACGGYSATSTATNVDCNGANNGAISVSISGGSAPYSYTWNTGATTPNLTDLAPGTYAITITDSNGCDTNTSATISQPTSLNATGTATNVSTVGGSNGAVNITVSGGTAPYAYAWSNGSTTEDISGLTAGTYTVTITDSNNCITTISRTVSQPSCTGFAVNASPSPASCNGNNDGSVSLTVSGGNGSNTYAWNDGATTQNLTNVTAATYTVTVTDGAGCTSSATAAVSQPTALSLNTVITDVSTVAGTNGAINLSVSGGTGPYVYLWTGGVTTQDLNNIPTGSYSVTVTDANGCSENISGMVTEPSCAGFTSSAVASNVNCNGANDGSINLTVSGGNGSITYAWSNGATTQDLSGLAPGNYSVTVTDIAGCATNLTRTISQPTAISTNIVTTDVSTVGGSDGDANLTVSGGTAPYAYTWATGNTTQDLNNVASGTYNVTITDANNCVTTTFATINEPSCAAFAGTPTTTDVSCNGANDGAVTLSVGGGLSPYSFAWSNGSTTQNLGGLTPGSYTVTITDDAMCVKTVSITVTQPTALNLSTSITDVSAVGGNDGSINLTAIGGVGPYTYLWSNGSSSEDVSSLPSGVFSVTVTDANNCVAQTSATINDPSCAGLSSNYNNTDVDCNGGNNGTITLTITGGTTPYTYNWSNGSTNQNLNGLTSGTYSVTITDSALCSTNETISINQPTALSASISTSNTTIVGGNNGSAILSISGGAAPYTYNWSNGDNSQNTSNLSAGTYTVTVTDSNNCMVTASATISAPSCASINSSIAGVNNVTCNGNNNGSIDIQVSGGAAPYTYSWSNGNTTQNLSGAAVGTYTVTITDAALCTTTETASITQPSALNATTNATNASTVGGSDGSITATPTGGTSPYSYAWSNGANSAMATNLSSGSYSVTVSDANGCSTISSAFVNDPACASLDVTINNAMDVSCNGNNDGVINITLNGGAPPYTYNWSNGDITEDISNLGPGNYTVTVTDNNACEVVTNASITEPSVLNVSTSATNSSTVGGSDGSATATPTGGTSPYSYAWNTGSTNATVTNLSSGSYSVTVSDANGCSVISSAFVNDPACASLAVTINNATDASCNGDNDGAIDITPSGGSAPYTYNWSNGANTEDINNLSPGNYTITVTDNNACDFIASASITEPSVLNVSTSAMNSSTVGGNDGSATATPTGGTTPYSYAWSNGANTATASNLTSGTYSVTVSDANACSATSSALISDPACTSLEVTINNATDVNCNGNNDGEITITPSGGAAPYTYNWSTGATTEDVNGLSPGNYTVTVTDNNACEVITSANITEPSVLSMTTNATNTSTVGGNDGSITATTIGGTTPYSYTWSFGLNVGPTANNLSSGSYSVTVTDINACTAVSSIIVNDPDCANLNVSINSVDDASCNGGTDGMIDILPSGGAAPYTYNWSNGASTEDVSNLSAGSYTLTVTDVNDCDYIASATVNEPSFPSCTGLLVKVKVFLEGAYGTSNMTNALKTNGHLPSLQPYGGAPWFYPGTEMIDINGIANNVVDWVLLEVRSSSNNFTVLETRAALVRQDGQVLEVDGSLGVTFSNLSAGQGYYVSVKHRNHVGIMSANAVNLPNTSALNLTQLANIAAATGMQPAANLGGGIYGLYAGDLDSDGVISVADFNQFLAETGLINQYTDGDLTFDASVTVMDFNTYFPNASVIGLSQIRY